MYYAIKEICWVSKNEGRLGVDITDIVPSKKVNNDEAIFQLTSSAKGTAHEYADLCIIAPLVSSSSNQAIWALPKEYSVKKELEQGDSVEVWSDGKSIMLNKLTEERKEEIKKRNEGEIMRVKKAIEDSKKRYPEIKINHSTERGFRK